MYSNELVCDILEFIDNNFKRDISIEEISFKFSFNRYYVIKKFKKEIGDSIVSYINKLRIYSSLDELNNTDNSIVLISISSGFNSLEYYSEIFKNIIGVSPSKYRKLFLSRYRKTEYEVLRNWGDLKKSLVQINGLNFFIQNKRHWHTTMIQCL